MRSVGQLKDGVSGLLSGTNLDRVTSLNKAFERAARKLVQKVDIPEATKRQSVTLYDAVYDYAISDEIFGSALIDLRPQGVSRNFLDDVSKKPISDFDRHKQTLPSGYFVAFEWDKGTPTIRVATPRPFPRVILDAMSETTGWTAAGSASGLARDTSIYYQTPASLRFLLTGASTGTLTKTLSQSLNISSYEDLGVAFLALRIPSNSLTSVTLRVGSSATDYDQVTATTAFTGAFDNSKWQLVAFDFSTATSTGTPDWTAIDYVQVRITHTATMTNTRIGGLWLALPSPHELIYQSASIFNEDGVLRQTIVDDDTLIVLNDAAYLLYEHECAAAVALQQDMSKKAQDLLNVLHGEDNVGGLYAKYRGDNPSEEIRSVGSYY